MTERATPQFPTLDVAVHGLGYVGAVTAACLAARGHRVVGIDVDEAKVAQLRAGMAPVLEPGLAELVARGTSSGRLVALELAARPGGDTAPDVDVHLVCVGTPSGPDGTPDTSAVGKVVADIAAALTGRSDADPDRLPVVVVRSTVLPGTVERLAAEIRQRFGLRLGRDWGLAMCPEFLREASAVADFFDPPFTVVGVADTRTTEVVRDLFAFLDRPFHAVSIPTAETLKYACNAFHATKVAFANEINRFAMAAGANGPAVMDILCQDERLNISTAYLRPGFPFGGSCLPKDLRALVQRGCGLDVELPLLAGVLPSNEHHLDHLVELVMLDRPRRVALLGLTFKTGTDDLRESPFVRLAERLLAGAIELAIWDPDLDPERLGGRNRRFIDERLPHLACLLRPSAEDALDDADAVVLGTTDPRATTALATRSPIPVIGADPSISSSAWPPDRRSGGLGR
ncbi:MAG: nucleotide sugar dehydrogenase [Acidimicrobiales bacterium]